MIRKSSSKIRIVFIVVITLIFFIGIGFTIAILYSPKLQAQTPSPRPVDPSTEWPQLQHDPQRTGYTPQNLIPPITNVWAKGFGPDRIAPWNQPVIAYNTVYIGSTKGIFYALNMQTGQEIWRYTTDGPILHSAGIENGRVFVGSMDGNVYALDAFTGQLVWRFESGLRTGFSTAVLLAENRVFIANRGGIYYALNPQTGAVIWQRDLGAPILVSSAYDQGRIFVPCADMRVRALNATDGNIIWTSNVISGQSLKDYYPVVHKGYVIVNTHVTDGFFMDTQVPLPTKTGPLTDEEFDEQRVINWLRQNPHLQASHFLNTQTGEETIFPSWVALSMNVAPPPPCVDRAGMLIVPVTINYTSGWHVGGWAKLDLDRNQITEVLWGPLLPARTEYQTRSNVDETSVPTCSRSLIFGVHTQEDNAAFTGAWDQDNQEWTRIGLYLAYGEMYFHTNTQGGGGSPVAVANGMIFHVHSWNTLNARRLTPVP